MTITTHRRTQTTRLFWVITAALIAVAIALFLTGCGKQAVESAPDPLASAAAAEEVKEEPTQEPPAVNDLIKQFGEIVTYDDGVSISVALIGPYTPGEYAQGIVEGQTPTVFKVVITNNSDQPLEPGAIPSVNSGGQPAEYIADVAHAEYGDLGLFPTTSILPGQTLEWFTAFGVTDPANINMDITPAPFEYDTAIFTNVPS
jgi:hypothetical protein